MLMLMLVVVVVMAVMVVLVVDGYWWLGVVGWYVLLASWLVGWVAAWLLLVDGCGCIVLDSK